MSIYKSKLNEEKIKNILQEEYQIIAKKIEKIEKGTANIYIIFAEDEQKYILKEFDESRKEESIVKEIQIINFLKCRKINVPQYIKTKSNEFYIKYENEIIILQKFIDGYTIENNTGDHDKVIESATILGRIIKELQKYKKLDDENIIEKWFSKESLENKIIQMEDFKKSIKNDNKYKEVFLKDLEDKIEIAKKLKEKFDFSIISKMSIMNSHGDYSVQQLIYNNEKETSVIDFESAKRLPIMWEIIRSYTYIDKDVKNGEMNIDTFVEYVNEISKYVELNEFDLKYCAYIYLIQIVGSLYGYKQYNENYEQTELLNFAIFRTNLCGYLYEHLDEIGTRLEKEVTEYMKKEKLDVLNERGEFTGIIETREECHKKGLWHRCVYAFVIDKNSNILLQKRSANKKLWPNLWDVTVGGHVDVGEFGRQALIRECKEELGIDICDKDIKYLVGSCSKTTKGKITNNQFNECYLITKDIDISKIKLQEEEVAEIKFFTKEEVLERINNNYDGLTDKTGPWNFLLKILEQR